MVENRIVHIKSDDQVGHGGRVEQVVGMNEEGRLFPLSSGEELAAHGQWRSFSSTSGQIEFRLPVGRGLTVHYEQPLECGGGVVSSARGVLDENGGFVLNLESLTYVGQDPRVFSPERPGDFYVGIVPGVQIIDTKSGSPLFSLPLVNLPQPGDI